MTPIQAAGAGYVTLWAIVVFFLHTTDTNKTKWYVQLTIGAMITTGAIILVHSLFVALYPVTDRLVTELSVCLG